jgi:transcriptional regulator with XRE-family HTH domain
VYDRLRKIQIERGCKYMALQEPIPVWSLGERFRKARRSHGISIEQMASEFGVSKSTVSHWEMDRSRPQDVISVIRRWAEITGVNEAWLAGLVTSQTPAVAMGALPKRRDRRQKRNREWDRRRPLGTPLIVIADDERRAEAA